MVVLDNGKLRAEIHKLGAEIRRVTFNGEERMWNADPEFWTGVAPVLFPVCGSLRDDKYTHEGKEYTLDSHGFARRTMFEVEEQGETYAVFLLKETEETLKVYPWRFELRVKYTLTGASIRVAYSIKNTSDTPMIAAIGSHEAYLCPGELEDYDVIFDRNETALAAVFDDKIMTKERKTVLYEGKVLPLRTKEMEELGTYVFTDLRSRFATLRNRKTGRSVSVAFDGFDYFLIWSMPGSNFICLEPWTGCPPQSHEGYELSKKEGMTSINPDSTMEKVHTIYFDK